MLAKKLLSLSALLFFLFACQRQSVNFSLIPNKAIKSQQNIIVNVDNCNNWLTKYYKYQYPNANKSFNIENLKPNGGEPFKSIRYKVWKKYGNPIEDILLIVPAKTKRSFNLTISKITYTGIVTGTVIDANKINVSQNAIYVYPLINNIVVKHYQDIICS